MPKAIRAPQYVPRPAPREPKGFRSAKPMLPKSLRAAAHGAHVPARHASNLAGQPPASSASSASGGSRRRRSTYAATLNTVGQQQRTRRAVLPVPLCSGLLLRGAVCLPLLRAPAVDPRLCFFVHLAAPFPDVAEEQALAFPASGSAGRHACLPKRRRAALIAAGPALGVAPAKLAPAPRPPHPCVCARARVCMCACVCVHAYACARARARVCMRVRFAVRRAASHPGLRLARVCLRSTPLLTLGFAAGFLLPPGVSVLAGAQRNLPDVRVLMRGTCQMHMLCAQRRGWQLGVPPVCPSACRPAAFLQYDYNIIHIVLYIPLLQNQDAHLLHAPPACPSACVKRAGTGRACRFSAVRAPRARTSFKAKKNARAGGAADRGASGPLLGRGAAGAGAMAGMGLGDGGREERNQGTAPCSCRAPSPTCVAGLRHSPQASARPRRLGTGAGNGEREALLSRAPPRARLTRPRPLCTCPTPAQMPPSTAATWTIRSTRRWSGSCSSKLDPLVRSSGSGAARPSAGSVPRLGGAHPHASTGGAPRVFLAGGQCMRRVGALGGLVVWLPWWRRGPARRGTRLQPPQLTQPTPAPGAPPAPRSLPPAAHTSERAHAKGPGDLGPSELRVH